MKKPEKIVPTELFVTCRNFFIQYIQTEVDSGYKFGHSTSGGNTAPNIEAKQFQYLIKDLMDRVKEKFPNISGQDLNIKVFQGLQMVVVFAHQNNYVVTALNLKTKLNNIVQHIINENKPKSIKGSRIDITRVAEWVNRA